jgi:mannose-6-phosphate isomerase-like protein (cupin superfamily)
VAELVCAVDTPDMLELWDWTMEPGESYTSDAHPRGTRELLHVRSGRLSLTVGNDVQELGPGDGVSFIPDAPHTYANPGRHRLRFTMSVLEPIQRTRP